MWNWNWLPGALGGIALTVVVGVAGVYVRRWWRRRGTTEIHIGDRNPASYITRGAWDESGQRIVQEAPRFMNFSLPLTIENSREVDLTIRIRRVWFGDAMPIFKKDGWQLPGSSLAPTGTEVRDASGSIADPIRIPAHGIEHVVVSGTATSPVCHAGPYQSWRYVFIDWISSPIDISPFVQEVSWSDGVRELDPDIEPLFPLPEHYPAMQGGLGGR